jgi:membrane protein
MAVPTSRQGIGDRGTLSSSAREQREHIQRHIAAAGAEAEAAAITGWGRRFVRKFNNDWTMNLVAMVAYNVLTSFFPLVLALITIVAWLPSALGSSDAVIDQINLILPGQVAKDLDLRALLGQVHRNFNLLGIISICTLLWGGSNLFGSIENAFAIVYRVKTRDFLPQKLMCLAMILLLVILLPLSFVSSLLVASATTTLGKIMPPALHGPFAAILGPLAGLAALIALFLAIYIVVPNCPVAWHDAWRGALVAAVTLLIVNTAFPFFTAHFVGTSQYGTAAIGTAIIAITWFWLFSLLTLVGAQVNALAMGIGPWPQDLTRLLMNYNRSYEAGASQDDRSGPQLTRAGLPFSGVARDSQATHGTYAESTTTADQES